jgi:hypothetical protein
MCLLIFTISGRLSRLKELFIYSGRLTAGRKILTIVVLFTSAFSCYAGKNQSLHPGLYKTSQKMAMFEATEILFKKIAAEKGNEQAVKETNAMLRGAYSPSQPVYLTYNKLTDTVTIFVAGLGAFPFAAPRLPDNNGNGNGGHNEKPGMFDPRDPPPAWLGLIILLSLAFWFCLVWWIFGLRVAIWTFWAFAVIGTIIFAIANKMR